ncbi:MAG: endonuclease [Bacilli bacterium]|nr:endonuclease [Bacilli bacterium]
MKHLKITLLLGAVLLTSCSTSQTSLSIIKSSSSQSSSLPSLASSYSLVKEEYYRGVEGLKGKALFNKLNSIVNNGLSLRTYGNARTDLQDIDEDPADSNRCIEIYTQYSVLKTDNLFNGNNSGFWNREHTYPQSRMDIKVSNSDANRGSDLHMLHVSDSGVNGLRGSKDYYEFKDGESYSTDLVYKTRDTSGGQASTATTPCKTNTYFFEPIDEAKGDCARSVFYMYVTYPNYCKIVRGNANGASCTLGYLETLLKWNNQDPVSEFEKIRNNKVESYQHNRNPFIDHPEWADLIFENM